MYNNLSNPEVTQPDIFEGIRSTSVSPLMLAKAPLGISLKLSFYLQTMNAGRAIGMFSLANMRNPLSQRAYNTRLKGRFGAQAFRGIAGDVVHEIGKLRNPLEFTDDLLKSWNSGYRPFDPTLSRGQNVRNWITEVPGRLKGIRNVRTESKLTRYVNSRKNFEAYSRNAGRGIIDKLMVSEGYLKEAIQKTDPELFDAISSQTRGFKGFTDDFLQNIREGKQVTKSTFVRGKKLRNLSTASINRNYTTLGDLIFNTNRRGRLDMLFGEGGIFGTGTRKSFRIFGVNRKESYMTRRIHGAFEKTVDEHLWKAAPSESFSMNAGETLSNRYAPIAQAMSGKSARYPQQITSTAGRIVESNTAESVALNVSKRARGLRIGMVAGNVLLGAGLALGAGIKVTKFVFNNMDKAAQTAEQFMKFNFGSGQILQNAALATERQRAMQAIQNAQMNARYLLGNEALMYH